MPYSAYVLTKEAHKTLLKHCPPIHPEVVGHHVTHAFPDQAPPPDLSSIKVIGIAQNDRIECVVVEVNGQKDRPQGGIYHITLSLNRDLGAKPVHSNRLLKKGWKEIEAFELTVIPTLVQT